MPDPAEIHNFLWRCTPAELREVFDAALGKLPLGDVARILRDTDNLDGRDRDVLAGALADRNPG